MELVLDFRDEVVRYYKFGLRYWFVVLQGQKDITSVSFSVGLVTTLVFPFDM